MQNFVVAICLHFAKALHLRPLGEEAIICYPILFVSAHCAQYVITPWEIRACRKQISQLSWG